MLLRRVWTLHVSHLHIAILDLPVASVRPARHWWKCVFVVVCSCTSLVGSFVRTCRITSVSCTSGHWWWGCVHRGRRIHGCCRVHGLRRALVLVVHGILGRWWRRLLIAVAVVVVLSPVRTTIAATAAAVCDSSANAFQQAPNNRKSNDATKDDADNHWPFARSSDQPS